MAEKEKVNYAELPKGLSKEEFTALPNFKTTRCFFIWAGIVAILTGVAIMADTGQICELALRYGRSLDDVVKLPIFIFDLLFALLHIVLGILLIKKKSTKIAYILAAVAFTYTILFIIAGGGWGGLGIAVPLALAGAIQIDKKWKLYQGVSGSNRQKDGGKAASREGVKNTDSGKSKTSAEVKEDNKGFTSVSGADENLKIKHLQIKHLLQAYGNKSAILSRDDVENVIALLKKSRMWIPYQKETEQLDILKNGDKFFFPLFSSQEELGEYGRQFVAKDKSYSEWQALAKGTRYPLSGIVINAFTDSFILNWELFDFVEGVENEGESETMYAG